MGKTGLGLLLKFVEKKYVESTLDGSFYFSLSRKFIDLEKEQFDKGIGDKREGSWSRQKGEKSVLMIGYPGEKMHPLKVKTATFYQRFEGVERIPILCFTYLDLENDFINDGDIYTLKDNVVNNLLKQFPERKVIGLELPKFFDQFDKALLKEGYDFKRDLITYYNEKSEQHPLEFDNYIKNPLLGLFYKRNFFKFQKEYRLAIAKLLDEDLRISIGDIREISNVWNVEDLKGLQIKMVESEEEIIN